MKKHKFTWIDALVIAIVVMLIAGTCIKFFVKDTTSVTQETVEFTYQIRIANVRQVTVDTLAVGDTVYENDGKGAVGVITEISSSPAKITYTASDGTIREAAAADRFDVVLTLSASGVPTGSYYKVGTYNIRVNHKAVYFTKYTTWNGQITAIN